MKSIATVGRHVSNYSKLSYSTGRIVSLYDDERDLLAIAKISCLDRRVIKTRDVVDLLVVLYLCYMEAFSYFINSCGCLWIIHKSLFHHLSFMSFSNPISLYCPLYNDSSTINVTFWLVLSKKVYKTVTHFIFRLSFSVICCMYFCHS